MQGGVGGRSRFYNVVGGFGRGGGVRMDLAVVVEGVEDIRVELVEMMTKILVGEGVDHTTMVQNNRMRAVIITKGVDM